MQRTAAAVTAAAKESQRAIGGTYGHRALFVTQNAHALTSCPFPNQTIKQTHKPSPASFVFAPPSALAAVAVAVVVVCFVCCFAFVCFGCVPRWSPHCSSSDTTSFGYAIRHSSIARPYTLPAKQNKTYKCINTAGPFKGVGHTHTHT